MRESKLRIDKTSELGVYIFEPFFFFKFPSFPPPINELQQLALSAVLEAVTKSGGCKDQPKHAVPLFFVPSDVFHRMSYILLFLA